jgi:hypothetical protein
LYTSFIVSYCLYYFSQDGVLEVLDSFHTVVEEGVVLMVVVPLVEVPLELLVP